MNCALIEINCVCAAYGGAWAWPVQINLAHHQFQPIPRQHPLAVTELKLITHTQRYHMYLSISLSLSISVC